MQASEFEIGDWVLFRPANGKIWKVCEVRDSRSSFYTREYRSYIYLKNLRVKNPEGSSIKASDKYGDILIRIPKNTKVEKMSLQTLVTLYAPKQVDLSDNRIFKKAKSYNIQINSRNESKMKQLIKLAGENGIELEEVDHANSNISAKYVLKDTNETT